MKNIPGTCFLVFLFIAVARYVFPQTPGPTLLTQENLTRAVAIESSTLVRDPLPVVNANNFSFDRRTRVSLFGLNMDLLPGENAAAITAKARDSRSPRLVVLRETDNSWGLLIPWALLALMFAGTYFSTKKHMASNKALSERVHYTFSASGFKTTAASFSGQTAWSNIYEAHETKTSFLIFLSKNMMYIIPKRSFASAEQVAAFKSLLRSQLDAKAKWK